MEVKQSWKSWNKFAMTKTTTKNQIYWKICMNVCINCAWYAEMARNQSLKYFEDFDTLFVFCELSH